MADKKQADGTPVAVPNLGIGVDLGTMNIVSARRGADGGVVTKRMRNVFLDLPAGAKKMLRLANTSYVERDDDVLILGDAAMQTANIFGKDPRRPLSAGIVSPSDHDALEVLALFVRHVLGAPQVENEACYFSVPAAPIDVAGRDVVYHRAVFDRIVRDCGFSPHAANEAMAIIFSETAADGFSGIALSFGSGMTNVALAVSTIEGLAFSVARGGDWLDRGVANSVGATPARVCAIKEAGVDLAKPKNRTEEALAFYYRDLINYVLDHIVAKFKQIEGQFALPQAIPLIVSGGTSMAGGFIDLFTTVFNERRKKFPITVSEIRHAKEPFNAVAYGLLVQALQEHE